MAKASLADVFRFLQRACALEGTCDLTDRQLLEAFLFRRDEGAFTFLVRRHGPVLFGACRRLLGNSHDAEDALQAAFLVLIRRTRSIRRKESVGSWLYGVAQRIARRTRTQTAARQRREWQAATMPKAQSPDILDTQELRAILDEEIGTLPEKYRAPIILHHLEGKSLDQAAHELGCLKTTLAKRVERARELLRKKLERRGITLAVAALATTLTEMAAAPLPATLTISTVKAATLVVAGKTVVGGCLSAHVLALMNEALRGMVWVKAKMVLAVAVIGLAAGGTGWVGYKETVKWGQPGPRLMVQAPAAKKNANEPAKQEKVVAKDLYDDPLPPSVVARLGTMRFRNEGQTADLLYSSNGEFLISRVGSQVVLWDVGTGKVLHRFERLAKEHFASPLDLSPDGSKLAFLAEEPSSEKPEIKIADLRSGNILQTLDVPGNWPLKAARESHSNFRFFMRLAPDGKRIVIADPEGKVHILDAATGRILVKVENIKVPEKPPAPTPLGVKSDENTPKYLSEIYSLAISPDGKLLALSLPGGPALVDMSTGKLKRRFEARNRWAPTPFAFFSDGKKLAWADLDWIIVSDPLTGAELSRFNGNTTKFGLGAFIRGLAFLPDGKSLLAGSAEGKVRHWDLPTGKLRQTFESHSRGGDAMALAPDGKTVAFGGAPPTLHFWNIETGTELFKEVQAHQAPVRHLAFTSDNKALISTGSDQEIRVWNSATWRQTDFVKRAFTAYVSGYGEGLALSPDGKRVARTPSANWFQISSLQVRDLSDGRENKLMDFTGTTRILCSQFSTDGHKLFVVYGGDIPGPELQLRLWDTATNEQEGAWTLSLVDKKPTASIRPQIESDAPWGGWPGRIGNVLLNADNKQALIEVANQIRLYDVEAGKYRVLPTSPGVPLTVLSLSPDGRVLAGGVDYGLKTIVLWEVATGRLLHELKDHGLPVSAFAWSADGRFLASGDAKPFDKELLAVPSVKLWDTVTGKELAWFTGFKSGVSAVCLSPDGRFLAAGLKDSTILVWDVSQKTLAARLAPKELSVAEFDACWADLMSDEPSLAQLASWKMADSPKQATDFLKNRLKDVVAANSAKLKRLVIDLSSDQKAVREAAFLYLKKTVVNPLIDVPDASSLRNARAIAALERIGSPEAKAVLEALSHGAPGARETEEAKASLDRLARRPK